jgi:hypothetical protein
MVEEGGASCLNGYYPWNVIAEGMDITLGM